MTDETGLRDAQDASRRNFLRGASGLAAAAGLMPLVGAEAQSANAQDKVQLSQINAPSEKPETAPGPFEAPDQRTGFAVVGLGRLAIDQILPAMGKSKYCRPVALVSGERDKALKIAAQYGIKASSVYDYKSYEQLASNPEVKVIYIVLPNSLHAEYVVRGAKTGKHILCEKPMATSTRECEQMIAACNAAGVKLMIAYRSQYEVYDRLLIKMIREGKLGKLKQFLATNSQDQGDPTQWRLKKALAGGGCMPDVGVYCLNAARFLSDEEPYEIHATTVQPQGDPRFTQVEASCQVIAKFPSGLTAVFNSAYNAHKSQWLRVEGEGAWAELNPAFAYNGIKLRTNRYEPEMKTDVASEPLLETKDQFAAEMDHFALCVKNNLRPHTPGEEGLQDQRLTDAIYESARTGRAVKVAAPAGPTRGPDPVEES